MGRSRGPGPRPLLSHWVCKGCLKVEQTPFFCPVSFCCVSFGISLDAASREGAEFRAQCALTSSARRGRRRRKEERNPPKQPHVWPFHSAPFCAGSRTSAAERHLAATLKAAALKPEGEQAARPGPVLLPDPRRWGGFGSPSALGTPPVFAAEPPAVPSVPHRSVPPSAARFPSASPRAAFPHLRRQKGVAAVLFLSSGWSGSDPSLSQRGTRRGPGRAAPRGEAGDALRAGPGAGPPAGRVPRQAARRLATAHTPPRWRPEETGGART